MPTSVRKASAGEHLNHGHICAWRCGAWELGARAQPPPRGTRDLRLIRLQRLCRELGQVVEVARAGAQVAQRRRRAACNAIQALHTPFA